MEPLRGGSRPSDKGGGGGGHPDPEISRGAQSPKKFFRLFGPHFDRKIRGRGGPLGPLPWIRHCPSPAILPSLKSF